MTVFDLRSLAPADIAWKRGGVVYVVCALVAIAVEILAFTWSVRGTISGAGVDTIPGLTDLLLIASALGAIGFGVAGFPRLLAGADLLAVDDAGVHLYYRSGFREDYFWGERSSFVLRDYGHSPELVRSGRAFLLVGPRVWRRRTLLTRDALEAILSEARRQRVDIDDHDAPRATGTDPPKVYRIRTRSPVGATTQPPR